MLPLLPGALAFDQGTGMGQCTDRTRSKARRSSMQLLRRDRERGVYARRDSLLPDGERNRIARERSSILDEVVVVERAYSHRDRDVSPHVLHVRPRRFVRLVRRLRREDLDELRLPGSSERDEVRLSVDRRAVRLGPTEGAERGRRREFAACAPRRSVEARRARLPRERRDWRGRNVRTSRGEDELGPLGRIALRGCPEKLIERLIVRSSFVDDPRTPSGFVVIVATSRGVGHEESEQEGGSAEREGSGRKHGGNLADVGTPDTAQ